MGITRILFFRERGCIGKQGEECYKTVTKCAHAYTVGCYLVIDGSIEEGMLVGSEDKFKRKFIRSAEASYAPVVPVYRALHRENEINKDDFLNNVEEYRLYNRPPHKRQSLEIYAVSVNEDKQQLITAMHLPNKERQILGIAKGEMRKECGPADFPDGRTHHNWYIFEDKIEEVMTLFNVEPIESNADEVMRNDVERILG